MLPSDFQSGQDIIKFVESLQADVSRLQERASNLEGNEPPAGASYEDYWTPHTSENVYTTSRITNQDSRVQYQPIFVPVNVVFDRFAARITLNAAAGRYLTIGFYDFAGNKLWDHYLECTSDSALLSSAGTLYTLPPGTYLFAYSATTNTIEFATWTRIRSWRQINNLVYTDLLSFYGANPLAGSPPIMPATAGARTPNANVGNSQMPIVVLFDGT